QTSGRALRTSLLVPLLNQLKYLSNSLLLLFPAAPVAHFYVLLLLMLLSFPESLQLLIYFLLDNYVLTRPFRLLLTLLLLLLLLLFLTLISYLFSPHTLFFLFISFFI